MSNLELSNRNTFCQCPKCQAFFRQSDTVVYEDVRPPLDWLEKLNREIATLEERENAIKVKIAKSKADATTQGRIDANAHIASFDTLFSPLGYDPNDAKVHFHPVDFIVFNGMNSVENPVIKNIVLLDSKVNSGTIQESIRSCIENEQYKFVTIKINNDGTVIEE